MQKTANHLFIANKNYDRFLIIYMPLVAFLFVISIVPMRQPGDSFLNPPHTPEWMITFSSIFIFMHVMLVFARSHLNSNVFGKFKYRFTLIPIAVFLVLATNKPIFFIVVPLSYIWDEIHSAMQTFGFGRIYDSKLGNDPLVGRKLDMGLCLFIEYYPHIVRLTILPYHEFYQEMDLFEKYAGPLFKAAPMLTMPMILIGVAYILFYIYRYSIHVKNGYKISTNKVIIYLLTGTVTIVTVCNYSIIEALIIGNLYHSVQYFAIVWVSEKKNLISKFKLKDLPIQRILLVTSFALVLFTLAYTRLKTEALTFDVTNNLPIFGAFWLTTSLLHFWYDGFIWSVRRKDI